MKNKEIYLGFIEEAYNIVGNLKLEEAYKVPAFSFILSRFVAVPDSSVSTSQNSVRTPSPIQPEINSGKDEGALANKLGVDPLELDRVYVWNGNNFEVVLKSLDTDKVVEKRQRLCHIHLTLKTFLSGDAEAEYEELKNLCEHYGIKDEKRQLSTNLRECEYLVSLGKKRSRDLKFRLTGPGKEKGIELIRNLLRSRSCPTEQNATNKE